jgi:hypothetical protein
LSRMGGTGLPARRSSTCSGSSGRPGWASMTGRLCSNGTGGGGGALRVISGGGTGRGADVCGGCGILSGGGATALFFSGGGGAFLSGGPVCRFGAGPTLPVFGAGLFAGMKCCARTGGAGTGLPGKTACRVGFTGGCGVILALDSCSGFKWTTC